MLYRNLHMCLLLSSSIINENCATSINTTSVISAVTRTWLTRLPKSLCSFRLYSRRWRSDSLIYYLFLIRTLLDICDYIYCYTGTPSVHFGTICTWNGAVKGIQYRGGRLYSYHLLLTCWNKEAFISFCVIFPPVVASFSISDVLNYLPQPWIACLQILSLGRLGNNHFASSAETACRW